MRYLIVLVATVAVVLSGCETGKRVATTGEIQQYSQTSPVAFIQAHITEWPFTEKLATGITKRVYFNHNHVSRLLVPAKDMATYCRSRGGTVTVVDVYTKNPYLPPQYQGLYSEAYDKVQGRTGNALAEIQAAHIEAERIIQLHMRFAPNRAGMAANFSYAVKEGSLGRFKCSGPGVDFGYSITPLRFNIQEDEGTAIKNFVELGITSP